MKTFTFHISVFDLPGTWRRIELTGEQTLRDLHLAIQDALDWEPDDDIAFIVGEDPPNDGISYVIYDDEDLDGDDWEDEDPDQEGPDDEEIEELIEGLPPVDLGDTPRPQSMEQMLDLLESNPDVRAQVSKMLTEQLGVPAFMADMLLSNAKGLFSMLPEGMLAEMTGGGPEAMDAAAASLESLGLAPGQSLLYVFGDDEWRFAVRVEAINEEAAATSYPLVLDGDGPAPQQYFDDEDDEDDWLWDDLDEDDVLEED